MARDAGWAKLVALCSMNAEAEARVLLRLATARREREAEGAGDGSKWSMLRDRWKRNDAGLSSSHGVTHAELAESVPFRPLRNPRRLFFVWLLTLGAIFVVTNLWLCKVFLPMNALMEAHWTNKKNNPAMENKGDVTPFCAMLVIESVCWLVAQGGLVDFGKIKLE